MADLISLQQIESHQKETMTLVAALETEIDPGRVQRLAGELEQAARALEQRVAAFEKQELDRVQVPKGRVEIVLTSDQRARILAETGTDLASLSLPDPTGDLSRTMRHADPQHVERLAHQVALEQRAKRESQEQTRAHLAQIFEQIDARGGKSTRAFIDRLRQEGGE